MRDFLTGRKKDLDLVIARPSSQATAQKRTLSDLADQWGVVLNTSQRAELSALPPVCEGGVVGSAVLVALEAKAAMTAHSKAQPRLYDELNSSHLTIHGASSQALAVGLVMVNAAARFISPGKRSASLGPRVSRHTQPAAAAGIIRKWRRFPVEPDRRAFRSSTSAAHLPDLGNSGSGLRQNSSTEY